MSSVRNIFCDECKHYQDSGMHQSEMVKDKCYHPDILNRSRYVMGTPITKGYTDTWTYPGDCFVENEGNDCELFEQQDFPDRG